MLVFKGARRFPVYLCCDRLPLWNITQFASTALEKSFPMHYTEACKIEFRFLRLLLHWLPLLWKIGNRSHKWSCCEWELCTESLKNKLQGAVRRNSQPNQIHIWQGKETTGPICCFPHSEKNWTHPGYTHGLYFLLIFWNQRHDRFSPAYFIGLSWLLQPYSFSALSFNFIVVANFPIVNKSSLVLVLKDFFGCITVSPNISPSV